MTRAVPSLIGGFVVALATAASSMDCADGASGARDSRGDGGVASSAPERDATVTGESIEGGSPDATDRAVDAKFDGAPDAGADRDAEPPRAIASLATGQASPRGIAVAGPYVYFTAKEDAVVRRVPIDGGPVDTLVDDFEDALAVFVEGAFVYAAMNRSQGDVVRVPIDGGTVETLATGQVYPAALAVSGTTLYFSTVDAVNAVGVDGGTVSVVAGPLAGPNGLAVASGAVFFPVYNDGTIRSAAGGNVTTIVTGQSNPLGIAFASGRLAFTCVGDGTVKSVLPDGGDLRTVTSAFAYPRSIVADGPSLYFTTAVGEVVRVGVDGSNPTLLASGERGPQGLAVDSTSVYWVTDPGGEVRSATPK